MQCSRPFAEEILKTGKNKPVSPGSPPKDAPNPLNLRPSHKRPLGCNGYVTAVVVGQIQRLYSGMEIFKWYYLSSTKGVIGAGGSNLNLSH